MSIHGQITISVEKHNVTYLDCVYSALNTFSATPFPIAEGHLNKQLPYPFTGVWVEKGVLRVSLINTSEDELSVLLGTSPWVGNFNLNHTVTVHRRSPFNINLACVNSAIMVAENQYSGVGNVVMIARREDYHP